MRSGDHANEYDGKGRLIRTSAPGQADTLYEYDELGNQIRTGLDVDGSGALEPASADRITESDAMYTRIGTAWWQESVQTVYAETGDDTAIPAGTQRTRITGLGVAGEYGILTGESVSVDIHGNRTVQKSYLDRADATEMQVVDYPDAEIDAVSVSQKGLLVSSTGKTGITVTYDYDTLARRTHVIDPRTGAAVTVYNAKGQVESVTDAAQNTTTFFYDPNTGRKIAERNALGQYTRYAYDDRGQVTHTWGDTAYPVKYVYDEAGRLTEMHTFREGENWSGETWPDGAEAAADITRWHYDAATGLLTAKEYADGTATDYDYETAGKLDTRTWARTASGAPLVTDYDYNAATGELTLIDYSDAATPDITFAYDRLGRRETVTDAVGIRTFIYNEKLQLESETIAGGGLYGPDPVVLTRTYEDGTGGAGVPGRNSGFTLGAGYAVTYGYDAATGRFGGLDWTAGSKSGSVNYGYVENSELLDSVTAGNIATTYSYEPHRNLKTRVENAFSPSVISAYDYRYDELGRRTSVVNTGIAFENAERTGFNRYGYNDRSEVTESRRYQGADVDDTGIPVDPDTRLYACDPIGNREQATEGTAGTTFYATNMLNQYTQLTGAVSADPGYDPDGNITAYDGKEYAWNGENRLVAVTPVMPAEGDQKVAFVYDYLGRRVKKTVYAYGSGGWQLQKEILFVYDGWNLIHEKEVSGTGDPLFDKFYVWGLDLSQTIQGAGGIGGLVCRVSGGVVRHYLYDANGNVGQLVDQEDGAVTARYEYDAFGKAVFVEGADAAGNVFRFSTKYWDEETGLVYYGYRYYVPGLGRWLSRDPIALFPLKVDYFHLFKFLENNPLSKFDGIGLESDNLFNKEQANPPNLKSIEGVGDLLLGFRVALGLIGSIIDFDIFRSSGISPVNPNSERKCQFLLTINGIFNTLPSSAIFPTEVQTFFADQFGTLENVGYVHNPTTWITDIIVQIPTLEAGAIGIPSIAAATFIQEAYDAAINECCECIDIYVIAHSQGAAILNQANALLSLEVRNRMRVLTIGAEQFIRDNNQVFGYLRNIDSRGDLVPELSPRNIGIGEVEVGRNEVPGHSRLNYLNFFRQQGLPDGFFQNPERDCNQR